MRGYITGSGWKDYQATGAVSGIELPAGLRESERLPEPLFTPSTKADVGHDEAIDFEGAVRADRRPRAGRAGPRRLDRALRVRGRRTRARSGIILADTKFELGLDADGTLTLGDEVLHAGLVALLARRRLRAGPRPAELRQAVRPRLGVVDRLGPQSARAADPRRRRGTHAREVRRGLRADHRRAVRRSGWRAPGR